MCGDHACGFWEWAEMGGRGRHSRMQNVSDGMDVQATEVGQQERQS
jgi:hypothetical protein